MTGNHAEWAQAIVAGLALLAAVAAYIISRRSHAHSLRPLLRPVLLGSPPALDRLALKNLGRGPAIAIVVVRNRGENPTTLAGQADALEPLGATHGPEFNETSRVGRTVVRITPSFSPGNRFRILYQDFEGDWHETSLEIVNSPFGNLAFQTRFLGTQMRENVPDWIRDRAMLVTDMV